MNKAEEIRNYILSNKVEEGIFADTLPTLPKGNPDGGIMVVGQNPGGKGKKHYPVIWENSPNSTFFMDCVKKAGIYDYCWFTNVVPYPTTDNKLAKWQILAVKHLFYYELSKINPKVIITLGNTAHNAVLLLLKFIDNVPPIINIPHPAYVNRLRRNDVVFMEEYIKSLSKAKEYLDGEQDGATEAGKIEV